MRACFVRACFVRDCFVRDCYTRPMAISARVLFTLIAAAASATCQIRLSPGVIVGTPLTDTLISSSFSSGSGTSTSFNRFHSETKRLLIGPSLTLELPRGLGLEFDALYQRIDYDSASGSATAGSFSNQSFAQTTANRWQFPFLLQYRRGIGKSNAFVEAGPAISTITGSNTIGSSTSVSPPSAPSTSSYTNSSPAVTTAGITMGGGVAIPLAKHHLRAEVRFSHWFANGTAYPAALELSGSFSFVAVPNTGPLLPLTSGFAEHTNEASFLLGFSF